MKRNLNLLAVICLTLAMSFSVSAKETYDVGKLYNIYSNINKNSNINKKVTNMPVNTMDITNTPDNKSIFSNNDFRFSFSLDNNWQMIAQEDLSEDINAKGIVYSFTNQISRGSMNVLLMDFTSIDTFSVDSFYQNFYKNTKETADNVSDLKSSTINGINFKYNTYTQEGINCVDYVANDGPKIYIFSFKNLTDSYVNNVVNTIGIGDNKPTPVTLAPAPVTQEPSVPSAPVEPQAPQTSIKVDNDLLYLYNNNVYKNDNFNFYITLDEAWQKPTYEIAHNFAFDLDGESNIDFTYEDPSNPDNLLHLITEFYKIDPSITLDEVVEQSKSNILKDTPQATNFSNSKKTVLHGVPFKYFTFDTKADSGISFKSYMYVGIKNGSLYCFSVINVNNNNKTIASKALKSIVIK